MKAITKFQVFVLIAVLISSYTQGSVIRFQAYPSVLKTNLTSSASMRCSLADTESSNHNIGKRSVTSTTDDILHISSIYITNSNGDDVAAISPYEAPIAYVDLGNLQVKGDVSPTSSEGFLELSWQDPSAMSMGEYVCNIQCTTEHHHPVVFSSTLEMTEVAPTVNDLITELKDLKQLQIKDSQQHEGEIKALKQLQITDSQEIKALKQQQTILKECAAQRFAFTAAMSSGRYVAAGQPMVFDKVILTAGAGYDNTTGVFTCSKPGIYSFSVTTLNVHNKDVGFQLKLNSDKITSAYSYSSQVETAATNAILHLHKNDKVQVVADRGSDFYQDSSLVQGNIFVGQLEQSDCVL